MISVKSRINNGLLKNYFMNSKCGFKTQANSLKSPPNFVKEQQTTFNSNVSHSLPQSYCFLHNVSLGTFLGSSLLIDSRRILLFTDRNSVSPILSRYFTTDENSPKQTDEKRPEKAKPKTQLKKLSDDESVINQILLEKYRVPEPQTTAEKVKEGVKDIYYFAAFAVAVVVTGSLLYYVFRELFSSKSPSVIYGRALKLVQAHSEVEDSLGTPIKGYGEETRRGRRRDVSHVEYIKDGINYMRVKFYVQGPRGKGVVRCEVKENEFGQYDFRYLLVELVEKIPMKSIIIIDDRSCGDVMNGDDGFVLVTKGHKRCAKGKPNVTRSTIGKNCDTLVSLDVVDSRILTKIVELSAHGFSNVFAQFFAPRLAGKSVDVVCYGLGNFGSCYRAQYQLALLKIIVEQINVIGGRVRLMEAYDPVFTETEKIWLEKIGFSISNRNEVGLKRILTSTVFYMPHCGRPLYNNVLCANWGQNRLRNVYVIGNSFTKLKENVILEKERNLYRYLLDVDDVCREFSLPHFVNAVDAFNDIAVHWFEEKLLNSWKPSFTGDEAPVYTSDCEVVL